MAKIKCDTCKFVFDGNESSINKNCPYCGKKGNLSFEKSAEEVVQDIDKFLEKM
jgi:predicted  nucleic acid-binding Zn-ribbon protein